MSVDTARPTLNKLEYRVVKSLGAGAGSTILQVADVKTGMNYALKIVKRLKPSDDIFLDQVRTEFDVSQHINHPNILKIHDLRVRKSWFRVRSIELLMEYVDGRTLDEFESLSPKRLIRTFIDVASGLEHMHRRGIYHGDLKPGNIMLSRTGQVKIIDFGTAWRRGEEKNRVQGTLQYMAPEQASRKIVDAGTDIYNFGATMYRMFTGHHANAGGIPREADGVMGHLTRPRPARQHNASLPTTLSDLIMSCIEPAPEKRPPDIATVRERLVAIAHKHGMQVDGDAPQA